MVSLLLIVLVAIVGATSTPQLTCPNEPAGSVSISATGGTSSFTYSVCGIFFFYRRPRDLHTGPGVCA